MDKTRIKKLFRGTFSVLFCLLVPCCVQYAGRAGYNTIRSITDEAGRQERFLAYSEEEQIDIYIYSESLLDTVKINIGGYLIVDGDKKLPMILRKIENESNVDPHPREILITAVEMIDERCNCLTADDLELLRRSQIMTKENDNDGIRMIKGQYARKMNRIELRYSNRNKK